jgi:hypothetical protein
MRSFSRIFQMVFDGCFKLPLWPDIIEAFCKIRLSELQPKVLDFLDSRDKTSKKTKRSPPRYICCMDKLKTILTLIAVIFAALAALAAIGLVYTLLYYLLVLGVLCLGTVIAFRLLGKSNQGQIDPTKSERKNVGRILDEYKRKQGQQ